MKERERESEREKAKLKSFKKSACIDLKNESTDIPSAYEIPSYIH